MFDHCDWPTVEAEAHRRAIDARAGNGRTLVTVAVVTVVALPFSLPIAVAFGLLGILFYVTVVWPAKTLGPHVLLGEVTGRSVWRKVVDPNELPAGVGKRSDIQHFAKWWLSVRSEEKITFRRSGPRQRSAVAGERQFAVPRDLYTSVPDGERLGFVLTPANDLLGCVRQNGESVWFDRPVDQSWRRGGYRVLDDPESWPEE